MANVLDSEPAYVPDGFSLRRRIPQGAEPGFGRIKDQTVLIYTTGWSDSDWNYPLVFYVALPGAPELVATEQRPGSRVELPGGLTGEYHDGIWVAQVDAHANFLGMQWREGGTHSITVRTPRASLAVRGPRSLATSELARMLSSFPS